MNTQSQEIESLARQCVLNIRQNLCQHSHPNYGIQLVQALWQAKLCGYEKISVIEFGVASGRGITALDKYVSEFAAKFQIEVEITGFDTGHGLPNARDYRDHPEIWQVGEYASRCNDSRVIFGDVEQTVPEFVQQWGNAKLAFVSLDVDLYSSTVSALKIFEMPADRYLPTVLVHVDDANTNITMNAWCGAELAINEFNPQHILRKFESKHHCWNLTNFYGLHVLDHPFRNGVIPPLPINCSPI